MPFKSDFRPPEDVQETALWFLFHDQRLLLRYKRERYLIPNSVDIKGHCITPIQQQFLGHVDDLPCYAGQLPDAAQLSANYTTLGRMEIFSRLEEDLVQAAGLANQLVQWNQNHQYCGKCGNHTNDKSDERARICPECGMVNYPRLSPAIIVAVIKDNQLLLASSKRFPVKFYSVLAGFVEPGETLEQCVEREVREEVGVLVKNIRYFGSQPWPFPDSLMIAFTAEYAGGDIRIDNCEIDDAGWFSADNLPEIPSKISIARHLIDWFVEART